MKWSDKMLLDLEPDEWNLLAWEIANEVINGFAVDDFQQRIGISEDEFKSIAKRLRLISKTENIQLATHDALPFRNALELTLDELGVDEFEIRTGYDFDDGNRLLQELNHFLEAGSPGLAVHK